MALDYERRQRIVKTLVIGTVVVMVVAAWLASTAGMAYLIAEWRMHGIEHAYVKIQMQRDAQHEAEHAALRQIIQMVNQQAQRPAPPAAPPRN